MASQTENLELTLTTGSDLVDPVSQLSDNFQKIDDKLGVDYIVEQGTSGEWWYRKWNSGIAECGIYNHGFGEHTMSKWGSIAKTDEAMTFGSYPSDVITWVEVPHVQINFIYDGSGSFGCMLMTLATTRAAALTAPPSFALVREGALTFKDPHLGIRVTGRWK